MRAAAYIRAEAADRDRQLALIRQRAEASGRELLDVYADPSGRRGNQPGFRRLLAAAEQRSVDVLIIERLDRLASSVRALVVRDPGRVEGCAPAVLAEARELQVVLLRRHAGDHATEAGPAAEALADPSDTAGSRPPG
jgi:hypothetical protein